MTTIYSTAAQPATSGALADLVRLLGDWANGFATYLVRREAIKALRAMNDRELRDIGISRGHIEGAVWAGRIRSSGGCARRVPSPRHCDAHHGAEFSLELRAIYACCCWSRQCLTTSTEHLA